jgi:hypothetical protein
MPELLTINERPLVRCRCPFCDKLTSLPRPANMAEDLVQYECQTCGVSHPVRDWKPVFLSPAEIIPPEVIRAREETHGHRMALWAKTYAIAIADPAMRERAGSAADEAVAAFNARFEPVFQKPLTPAEMKQQADEMMSKARPMTEADKQRIALIYGSGFAFPENEPTGRGVAIPDNFSVYNK